MLLYDIVRQGAQQHPDRTAVLFRESTFTYAQLEEQVNRLASALKQHGVTAGDSVAVLMGNCPQFTVAYFAISAIGAVCVPANPLLKPAELSHIWSDSEAKAAIVGPTLVEHARVTQEMVPSVRLVVSTGASGETPEGVLLFTGLLDQGEPAPVDTTGVDPDMPAVCIYTSGTTGRPKGAMLSHRNLTANARQVMQAIHFTQEDCFLCVLPLFHSFAGTVCQNTALLTGARVAMLEMFHPARVLEAIEEHAVSVFPGVPAMYGSLLQHAADGAFDLSSVRICVSGGAPMPTALMAAFEQRFGAIIIEGDGPTECSPVTAVNPPEGPRKPGSIGPTIPGVEMRIIDDHDRELPDGEVGEIAVRGDNVMLGYRNLPEATADAMRGGWYHTGDLGKRDADGYFYIVDRKKDMLIIAGLNVYPREVEEVLYAHESIADAAVVGAPDALRGEEVVAIVVLKPGAKVTGRQIIQYCRERLANYKVPRRVLFRDSLPRGGTGKVLKRLLRKELDMEGGNRFQ